MMLDDDTNDQGQEEGLDSSEMLSQETSEESGSPLADFGISETDENGDDLAAAWGASLEGGDDQDRTLSQNEIDNLLGINGGDGSSVKKGIYQILNTDLIYSERLPMLEVVFDRLVRLLSTSLRNFTNENVEVNIETMASLRFGDYLNSIPLPAMINVFKARQWNDFGLMTVDSALIYSIVDVLLGGRKGNALMRIEGRPYTTIERQLIQRMVELVLADLRSAFGPLCEVNFDFDRMETNPTFAAIARPANAAISVRIRIDMDERGGKIDFLIPYSTVEPIRDLLLQTFMGEKFGQDSIWENHLENQLWSTNFTLEATLGEVSVPLSKVLELEVGSQILLNATPESKAFVKCGEKVLFSGCMGRKGHNLAVKIEDEFIQPSDMEVHA